MSRRDEAGRTPTVRTTLCFSSHCSYRSSPTDRLDGHPTRAYDIDMPTPSLALLAALISAWFMTGVIWFVQIVHYPLFAAVGVDGFRDYHTAHARLTTWVVALPMLIELLAAGRLALVAEPGVPPMLSWLGFVLALSVWASTMLVQVPLHDQLARGFDLETQRRLVLTNLARAILWSGHAAVATLQLLASFRSAAAAGSSA